jgi:hypothetical protein
MLDYTAGSFLNMVQDHEGRPVSDLPNIPIVEFPDSSYLSRQSRRLTWDFGIGCRAWRNGWARAQSSSALTQAAFAIMAGQPVPCDPIFGQPYLWDPTTRILSPPNSETFKSLNIKPITVPRP